LTNFSHNNPWTQPLFPKYPISFTSLISRISIIRKGKHIFLITKNARYIFTDGRYTEAISKTKTFQLIEISSGNSFENLLKNIIEKEKILSLGIEESNITVAEHKKISPLVKNLKTL